MANDLYTKDGNASYGEMMSKMKPKNKRGANFYNKGAKGPKLAASKQVEKGYK